MVYNACHLQIGRNYLSNEGVELILNGIQDHPTLNDLDLGVSMGFSWMQVMW